MRKIEKELRFLECYLNDWIEKVKETINKYWKTDKKILGGGDSEIIIT